MRKIFFFLLSFLALANVNAQILDPVKWTTKIEKISDIEFNLVMDGKIEDSWHVYSQFTPDGGPIPAELLFENAKGNFEVVGKAKESPYKKQFNEIFEVDEYYFEKTVTFRQKINILNSKVSKISLTLEYQVCKDVCINQKKNFTFTIPKISSTLNPDQPVSNSDTSKVETVVISDTASIKKEVLPVIVDKSNSEDKKGLWTIFFLAFLGGFAALLTPCVFPLIPMTVSFFTKQSKTKAAGVRNAIIYGISIIIIYVLLGTFVTYIFGSDALNALATNVWFNLIFFALLIFFASSFLGAFEIMLPNSWANKVDRQADKGGIIGILFMALALAIVSFSCTGPIVGTLLFEAASKGGIGPIVGMLGFSLALALPFMLFAMFPGWLNSLPRSGGWLNTVKVFLGFLELALAFKFLSNADLVLQLHLLEREIFLAIWIAIFGILTLYLFGKITTPHDSPLPFISVGRLFMGLLVLTFTIYLVPGLFGAPLKLISAFPPPLEYSESPFGVGNTNAANAMTALPKDSKSGPHGIVTFEDYEKGLAYAKSVNKPILIDFTGRACVNCRKMEINVWSDKNILPILNNDLVLISLYVDEAINLPKEEQFVSKSTGSKIVTVGDKWTDFIITRYKTNTQPFYVLVDLNEENLNTPISYTPNVQEYENWLKDGISKFKK